MTLCYLCEKGELELKPVPYHYQEWYLGDFEAEACPACSEVFFTEAASDAMDAKARELGLWGLDTQSLTVASHIDQFYETSNYENP